MAVQLSGYYHDDSGVAVSGATAEAISLTDGLVKASGTTSASGKWSFSGLADDTYKVRVTHNGFVGYPNIGDSEVQYASINLAGTISPQGLSLPAGTSFPGSPVAAQVFYRTDLQLLFIRVDSDWQVLGGGFSDPVSLVNL